MVAQNVWGFLHCQNPQSLLPHLQQALVVFQYALMIQVLLRAPHRSPSTSLCFHEMKGEKETCVAPHHPPYLHQVLLISCVLKVPELSGSKGETTVILWIGFPVQDPDLALLTAVPRVIVDQAPEDHLFLGLVHHFS
jgi:hypothetical protein